MKAVVAAAGLAACTFVFARPATDINIVPGPAIMSSEEKALEANPAAGIQHGIILIDETEQDDNKGSTSEVAHHLRAKILSPEARGLADIAVPVVDKHSNIVKFWARSILADGTVLELRQDELKSQSIAKSRFGDYREMRGAIPGVVPGCVIDYGYVIRKNTVTMSSQVMLQRAWPVKSFRYRWVPSHFMAGAYVMSRGEGLPITPKVEGGSVLIVAHDLPKVPDEPLMPPENESRASVTFYYTGNEKTDEFWEQSAKRGETMLKSFLRGTSAVHGAIESMHLPSDATLDAKLRAAYDWIGANIKNPVLLSAEEEETTLKDDDDEAYSARTVLMAREGNPQQIDMLFTGIARALGAEANLVFAVDRTNRFWTKGLKSFDQFAYTFTAVRAPGPSGNETVVVDAGSGLDYGQVPWRATGANAFVCGAKGGTTVLIPPSSPAVNRADTHVTLSFADENETMTAKWSRTSSGAAGFGTRRWFRNLDPRERKDELDEMCGASSSTEVLAAELPELDQKSGAFQIACDLEVSDMNADGDIARYTLGIKGAWWPATPEFTADTRQHPIIFDYPKLDILSMDVTAPHGFKPKDPPAPVELNSQYGRYTLAITKTATGFHVDRAFALTVLLAKPPEYAALRKYFADVHKADETFLAFEKSGSAP